MTNRGQKIKDAFMKKYGVSHPSQLPWVKDKIKKKREAGAYDDVVKNMKKTLLERYGNENYVNVEQVKKTKLEKYGDATYNNRDKMLQTNNEKYGMNISPNTLKSITDRTAAGEIGFKSDKFKNYLKTNDISNVSQLQSVKVQRKQKKIDEMIEHIFNGSRLKGVVIPLFKREDYIGSEYNNLYKFRCGVCNNEFDDNLYSGNIPRCLVCYPHARFKSKVETEIFDFLKQHILDIKQHDRSILNGNEIDIYIPSLNLGIECDGVYWHSELAGGKDKKYHLTKTQTCASKNVNLLHIWDWEWLNKREIVESILLNKLSKSTKIYARKCIIQVLSETDKSSFLFKNHIQGDDNSSIKLGLYYNDNLVSVMTFIKSRYDKKYQYEMSRYCTLLNTTIIGGASKLFKHFINTNQVSSIVTYADKRFFNGNVYNNIGMSFVSDTPPSYHYFHKNYCAPIDRTNFQKHKLSKKLTNFDPKLSEWQNMQLNGFDRIWDCGHLKFEWIKS